MAKGGIEAPSEAEIKELSEIVIPEKPSREEERLLGMFFFNLNFEVLLTK